MTDQPAPPASPAPPAPPAPSAPEPAWAAAPPPPPPSNRPGPMAGWHYAGFWVRFLAILIDGILLGIVTSPFAPQVTTTGTTLQVNAGGNAIGTVVGLIYFVALWAWRGQTVGMMPFNMRVVGVADGKNIDVMRGLLRYVGFIISIIPLFLGLIWAAFDSRKQGWHDKIAGTVVIRPN